jgi:endonuclease/exonuclease/phosphatase family metal-dependent hydrolase
MPFRLALVFMFLLVAGNARAFTILTYNCAGNGSTNWSTNASQVQAIGRQMVYLQPDIVTFQEIPYTNTYQMTNFVKAYLPGYFLATNSGTDGFLRSVIASRYVITRSTKWLDGVNLDSFGYTNSNFTRDLFEAQITVPGFSFPLHVFTTHLKSTSGTTYADASAKRAAETAAVTNFFATNFFILYPNHPYLLTGDMNENDTNALAIQRLVSTPTGLHLTSPVNPVTGSINTYGTSSANPSSRLDYIMPCALLATNIASSQVFRTDRLTPLPPNLFSNDCKTASDHLSVIMTFNNPYDFPFRLTSLRPTNQLTLNWLSMTGMQYQVDVSSNLPNWTILASNVTAAGSNATFTTNMVAPHRFFRIRRIP